MKIHNVAQGTTAWADLRAGMPTASEFDKIITPKGEPSSSAHKYMCKLIAERICGQPIDGFVSQWMERGSEMEAKAVQAWEFTNDCETERIGFVTTDDGLVGASPDRFIVGRPKEALEVKCPSLPVHVGYLLAASGNGIDKEYKIQAQGQLWVCEKEINTLISFHPDVRGAEVRLERDEKFVEIMERRVRDFCGAMGEAWDKLIASGLVQQRQDKAAEDAGQFGITDEDIAAMVAARFPQQEALNG